MTNKAIVPSIPGSVVGVLDPAVQNGVGVVYTIYLQKSDGSSYGDMTGYTISGVKADTKGNTSSLTGTLAWSNAAGAIFTWTAAAADVGTSGEFRVFFTFVSGAISITARGIDWSVATHPAATVVAAPGVTGVSAAEAALLTVISGLTGLIKVVAGTATGVAIQTFMQTFLTSATALAARANLLPSYTGNAGKVFTVNVGETDGEWTTAGGGASDVEDLTTTNGTPAQRLRVAGAGGLEYRTTEQDLADLRDAGALATPDIGVIVQGYDADLAAIAALTPSNDDIAQRKAGVWTSRTVAQYKVDLGISGTMTGGGVLATGGFTLTVPATGTAALLAVGNTFTATQQVTVTSSSATGMTVTNSGAAADTVGVRGSAPTGMGVQGLTNSGVALEGFIQAASSTSAINTALRLASRASGTPGAGFGTQILVRLETSTTNDVDTGRLAVLWNTATHASRVPDGVFYLTDSAAEREIWRGRANGSAAAIGFLGATPVARAAHIADTAGDDATAVNAILVVLENLGFIATS